MFSLVKKLKALKGIVKDINKDHYSNLEQRVKETQDKLSVY